jgi:pyridoxal phosphate enzyme (YggS family)
VQNEISLRKRLENVCRRIEAAAVASGRDPAGVRLVAVSKTIAAERIKEAIQAGVDVLGENYIQEARHKVKDLAHLAASWHFIGHLQTNKAKYAIRLFDLIHSVDTYKLAAELDKQAKKINKIQPILIQVNVAMEASKSGVSAKEVQNLLQRISTLKNVSVRGLMTMPPFFDSPERVRPFFAKLRDLRDHIRDVAITNVSMDELSMGMTGDFEVAIEEGATLVRIGTAIFGKRN